MDSRLLRVAADPANEIFAVVFFPDRIYHEAYLNATRSPRYRYNVQEVRGYYEVTCLKGQVFLDGGFLCNFIRIEYRGGRLTEMARVKNRFLRNSCTAWMRLTDLTGNKVETSDTRPLTLHYDDWINAYQAELWETLEPPGSINHAAAVLAIMGRGGEITRMPQFEPMLADVKSIGKVELAFRGPDRYYPFGSAIQQNDIAWDNNFGRTHQAPVKAHEPSASENTVPDLNYLLDFQRGWYKHASDVVPVLYRNAMMMARPDGTQNPDARDDNIIAMRWLFQRELGGSMIFFHEVTIPPGKVEGNHQHIGSEELYYIVEGEGVAYLRVGDDPAVGDEHDTRYKTVDREVMGLGTRKFKELPVKSGSMIYTKSGGMHGIRNPPESKQPLKFVAFLYHSA
jgi:hypothetical protein